VAFTSIIPADEALNGVEVPGDLQAVDLTGVRLHGYALRRWFYRNFLLREGFPVPVVYAIPMDAFAEFRRLYTTTNTFDYLKSTNAQTLNVWPQNTVTPLISFVFRGDHYRPDLTASTRVNRTYAWLSAGSNTTMSSLGEVQQVRYSQGADFNFQVDFWCQKPETQAIFYEQLSQAFRVSSAGTRQTWVTVPYPVTHGTQVVRLIQTSDGQDLTEYMQAPEGAIVMYHTSFTVSIEGYYPDRTSFIVPTLWYMTLSLDNPGPTDLDTLYLINNYLLPSGQISNPTLALRTNLPPGTGAVIPAPLPPLTTTSVQTQSFILAGQSQVGQTFGFFEPQTAGVIVALQIYAQDAPVGGGTLIGLTVGGQILSPTVGLATGASVNAISCNIPVTANALMQAIVVAVASTTPAGFITLTITYQIA